MIAPLHPTEAAKQAEANARRVAAEARANAAKATTINSLKAEVVKLAEAVEFLLDRQ